MPKERKGSFTTKRGNLYARLSWVDDATGERRERYKQVVNRTEGKRWMKEQLRQLEDYGAELLNADQLTLAELIDCYKEAHVHEAEIVNGRKVAGLKSVQPVLTCLNALQHHLGRKPVQSITHADLLKYKRERLKTKTVRGTARSITTVNRELQQARAVLNFAIRQGWLLRNPFTVGGDSLISAADEVRRDRILTADEEERLLAVCTGRREHLRAIVIAAMDTAARRGELLKLKWRAVDLDHRIIVLEHSTTKTAKQRLVPITRRLEAELRRLWAAADQRLDANVFTIGGQSIAEFKRSFRTACQLAGITGLTFHDLRHCATTKMVNAGLPAEHVMAATGHTQSSTFRRYINTDVERVQTIAAALDAMQSREADKPLATPFIN
jgi:integrase